MPLGPGLWPFPTWNPHLARFRPCSVGAKKTDPTDAVLPILSKKHLNGLRNYPFVAAAPCLEFYWNELDTQILGFCLDCLPIPYIHIFRVFSLDPIFNFRYNVSGVIAWVCDTASFYHRSKKT